MSFLQLVPPIYYNVMQYGAVGNGIADDTASIQACINAAANGSTDGTNVTGSIVIFPLTVGNTYLHTGLTLYNNVGLLGNGATVLKLANNANADCIQGYNALGLIGGSSTGGIYGWSISNLIIDGNKANQTGTSYGLRVYGYGYRLHNVVIRNCFTDTFYSDWNGGASTPGNDSMEASIIGCKFHDSNGIGVNFHGPHDSQFVNCISYKTGSHAFYVGPNAGGVQFTQCHGWGMTTGVNAVTWLIEGQTNLVNCQAEGSDVMQVAMLASNCVWSGGRIFSGGVVSNNTGGLQIGQAAGNSPYPGSVNQSGGVTTAVGVRGYFVDALFNSCEGTNGSVLFANDSGKGYIRGPVILNSSDGNTNSVLTGSINSATHVHLTPAGTVPTPDGTTAKGGRIKYAISASNGVTIGDTIQDITNVNTFGKRYELVNGTILRLYSDNYTTRTVELSNGTISLLQSTTAAVIATSGTITTSGVGVARVAPTGTVTGIILQSGTNAGQMVHVINESAFSVTFAASGTSHVAQGTSTVIPANGRLSFCWDSSTSLWY